MKIYNKKFKILKYLNKIENRRANAELWIKILNEKKWTLKSKRIITKLKWFNKKIIKRIRTP